MNLAKRGANIHDNGYIGLSKKRKNQVISNVIGAAAYHGANELLKALLVKQKTSYFNINYPASEK